VPAGLVGAWSFNESAGSIAGDSSGQNNNGDISGATHAAGKYGQGLTFDGTNDMVSVPATPSLNLTKAVTLEAWVKPDTLGTKWRTIAVKEQSTQLAYALYANNGRDQVSGNVFTTRDNGLAGPRLAVGAWTHLAATWDGTTAKVYVDGKLIRSAALGGTMASSSKPLRFGGNTIWPEWFKGQLDEIRIYNRALSAAEVQSDLRAPIGTSALSRSGVAAKRVSSTARRGAAGKTKGKSAHTARRL
jgi:hypothetical protein